MSKKLGDCYGFANNKARQLAEDLVCDELYVVHGKVTNSTGKSINHAWVECDQLVFDEPHSLANVTITKTQYYRKFKVSEIRKYTLDQAMVNSIKTGHHGPWSDDELSVLKKNPSGDDPVEPITDRPMNPPYKVFAFAPHRINGLLKLLWFDGSKYGHFHEFNYSVLTLPAEPTKIAIRRSLWFENPRDAFDFAEKIADMDRVIVVVEVASGLNAIRMWFMPFAYAWTDRVNPHMSDSVNITRLQDDLNDLYRKETREVFNQFKDSGRFEMYDRINTDWY